MFVFIPVILFKHLVTQHEVLSNFVSMKLVSLPLPHVRVSTVDNTTVPHNPLFTTEQIFLQINSFFIATTVFNFTLTFCFTSSSEHLSRLEKSRLLKKTDKFNDLIDHFICNMFHDHFPYYHYKFEFSYSHSHPPCFAYLWSLLLITKFIQPIQLTTLFCQQTVVN